MLNKIYFFSCHLDLLQKTLMNFDVKLMNWIFSLTTMAEKRTASQIL